MMPGPQTIDVLGFATTTLSRTAILEQITSWIRERRDSHHVMALNPIKVCRAQKEKQLSEHIREADLVYPDAFGIAWAMRQRSGRHHDPIPGCDLMLELIHTSAMEGYSIYLLGATDAVVQQAQNEMLRLEPKLKIVGHHSGFFKNREDEELTLKTIVSAGPDIVFVGMGALIQENWIRRIQIACRTAGVVIPVLMGVGGSFDAITGTVRRPPRWMLNLHLEWFFRLLQQPLRAPRMLALPRFAFRVLKARFFTFQH
jgi:N-acetylglucosaminyldiphosphoundecaprenol N-acetyl-beta-D-mannosaminyltransferase